MRSNWARATDPRPELECPRCGDDRQTERIGAQLFCNVCSLSWYPSTAKPADSSPGQKPA